MGKLILIGGLAVFGWGWTLYQEWPREDGRRCAPIEKDVGEIRACKCAARDNNPDYCDKDGNRTNENMPNCGNHCTKSRCGCCRFD